MKSYLLFFLGLGLLASCNILDVKGSTDLTNDKAKIISIDFNTTGGGDVQFKISPVNSEYKINIIRYRYASASVETGVSENTNTELYGL